MGAGFDREEARVRATTLARKSNPGTVTRCVVGHGAGAINIDRNRIGTPDPLGGGRLKGPTDMSATCGGPEWDRPWMNDATKRDHYAKDTAAKVAKAEALGRWPSNLILQHRPGCKQVGTVTTPGYTINRWTDGAKPFGGGAGHEYESDPQPDEEVAVWDCEGCAVQEFDVPGRSSGHYLKGLRRVGAKAGPASIPIDGTTSRSYSDSGAASRYFKQVQETVMHELPQELIDYLETMITPPDGEVLIVPDIAAVDWSEYADGQLHGLVILAKHADEFEGTDSLDQIWRVLRPGAHVAMIASDEQPTGHTNTCSLEDQGFEIRDAILLVQEPGRIHYVAKASTRERNTGIAPIKKEVVVEWCYPRDDTDLDELAEVLAEVFDSEVIAALADEGIEKAEIPKEFRDYFDTVKLNKIITTQNDHPTLKPIALMERLMADVPAGATVLDPFMGSGTTGLACVKTNHSFIGIDLDEHHVKIASARAHYWESCERRPWSAKIEADVEPEDQPDPFAGMFG
jgi:DNA modification methylase